MCDSKNLKNIKSCNLNRWIQSTHQEKGLHFLNLTFIKVLNIFHKTRLQTNIASLQVCLTITYPTLDSGLTSEQMEEMNLGGVTLAAMLPI